MFRFGNPYAFYLLLIIPAIMLLFIWIRYLRNKNLSHLASKHLISQLMPDVSIVRPNLKFVILNLALFFLIVGLARPQFGKKVKQVKRKGMEIVIAIDVSNSMNANDIQPSRLTRAKQSISQLIDKLNNDRIGLIVFAGEAYNQMPVTTDYVSAKMFLSNINTGMVPVQGTSLSAAIDMGILSFTGDEKMKKSLIIITDGESHEDEPIEKAKEAAAKGIHVFTIGVGSTQGVPIPDGRGFNSFKTDRDGNVVVTKLNEEILKELAMIGNGAYVRASSSNFGLNIILDEIEKMEKKEYEAKIYTDFDEQYRLFYFIALLLLIIDLVILEKKNKWLSGIKLFEIK